MNRTDKEMLEYRVLMHYQIMRIKAGAYHIIHQKKGLLLAFLVFVILGWQMLPDANGVGDHTVLVKLQQLGVQIVYILAVAMVSILLLLWLGTPAGARKIQENLWRSGLINHAGEAPFLIQSEREKDKIVMEFEACGIPMQEWQDKKQRIETALNIHILKIAYGKNRERILLYAVSGEKRLPDILRWKDIELSEKEFELVLGWSFGEKVRVDLTKVPHILLGGSTGSGKSVLLKLLLMQCVKKGAEVYIADFKGGVDFSAAWHRNCKIITEEMELLEILSMLVEELEKRKILFRESGCANLMEYRKHCGSNASRLIFACDEVAEVLDKTGLSKEQKDLVTKIESKLSVIARQGRAFGIHLILATQRPDANILSGQIRNNIDYRVCGRADNVLSQIILDNTVAADEIPKDEQGLFMNYEGTVFRGFLIEEAKPF